MGLSVLGALLFAPVALAQDNSSASASASSSASASASVGPPVGYPPPGVGTPLASFTASGTAVASGSATVSAAVGAGGALPATGGEGVAILAGALLLGAGVLSYAIVRRTS